ncbi:MAG: dipeptide/oligopeptide/nickel ABC transporter permease/ATP-binding protein [Bifidobacteriaceae bacterium]|jgi:ABC-type dipeptide/oligopeptide/nickel transport system ATPase component/ABC-type dipeptide/oligopeptide/nickel transport system permease subunit|nr:dipeptide/oligopeptide/nickel ABC transporter permease/ATP-binding protein [Bifidobacteriaceae bacterium]
MADATPDTKRRFAWNGTLICGLVMGAIILLTGLIAPFFLTEPATALGGGSSLGSVPGHPLGTDSLGRDMLARTLVATRLTVVMALGATAIAGAAGIALGIAVWLAPRKVRELGLRGIEFAVSYPTLLVAIMVAAILGKGTVTVVIAIGVANTAGFARLTANLAAGLSQRDYVTTARLIGVPRVRLATRHILPNMAEPMLILVAQAFAGALVEISGLSFVGLGSQSPSFDYGTLLRDALGKLMINPVLVVGPAMALVFASLAALFIGDGLAAAANPRSIGKRGRLRRVGQVPDAASEPPVLTATGVTVRHAATGRVLVEDVSFEIARGEILGIVGESGSGKSLTAAVVSRLVPEGIEAEATRLALGRTDLLGRVSQRELATRIGLVYQDPGTSLNPALTLGSQFGDVLTHHRGLSRKQARQVLVDGFAAVLLPDPAGRLRQHPHELSGGMKQRAMIASAMSTQPDLLIADEPTTALDVTVQREVLAIIKRLNRQAGTAVLFISHDIGVVRRLCDRVLVMREGRVVERIADPAAMTPDNVTHPYTAQLLAATPTVAIGGRAAAPAGGTAAAQAAAEVAP